MYIIYFKNGDMFTTNEFSIDHDTKIIGFRENCITDLEDVRKIVSSNTSVILYSDSLANEIDKLKMLVGEDL